MNAPSNSSPRPWTGRLAFYHPTQSGGGAVARLEFHPARPDRDGCFFLEMARQKTLPARTENGRQAATFDWENKLTVKLGLPDVCSLLLVLEGKCEQAGNGRGGLFHDTAESNTIINLRRQPEPAVGFALEVSRKAKRADAEVQRVRVVLTDGEAVALRCVFQHAMFPLVFGDGTCELRPQRSQQEDAANAEEPVATAGGGAEGAPGASQSCRGCLRGERPVLKKAPIRTGLQDFAGLPTQPANPVTPAILSKETPSNEASNPGNADLRPGASATAAAG